MELRKESAILGMMRKQSYLPNLAKMPLSAIFYALSDPVRLAIVRRLLQCEEAACCEFDVKLSKSTLSHHFKVLRQVGLLQKRGEGTRQINSLRTKELEKRCPGLLKLILGSDEPL